MPHREFALANRRSARKFFSFRAKIKCLSDPGETVGSEQFILGCACRSGRSAATESFMHGIIIWLIIGGLAGWIAGLIVQGTGFGILGDIVVGIVGAIVAGWLLPQLGIHIGTGFVTEVVDAIIGAVILLVVVGLIRRAL
jgi:uncharacterized membrane protein YeaQ/YmgE (transglycosylase-associated protein family)